MALDPKLLRRWILTAGALLVVVVIGFYSYARYLVKQEIREIPKKLGIEVQQSTEGFTFSKSEGGRTLFTISAGKAVQFKQGQKASLQNVRIVVFGGGTGIGDRYDQIYGKEFAYDPESGEVTAKGEVQIDLQARGKPSANPAVYTNHNASSSPAAPKSAESQNAAIHLKTSGLTFNQKTGIAHTTEALEFLTPQASGRALGALYDSKQRSLILNSNVEVRTAAQAVKGTGLGSEPAIIQANHAVITNEPLAAVLSDVRMEERSRTVSADKVTIALREDNTVEKVVASGNVMASAQGKTNTTVNARQVEFTFSGGSMLRKAVLSGNVELVSTGASPLTGSAGNVVIEIAGRNEIAKIRASDHVKFEQGATAKGATGRQATQIAADAVDFFFRKDNQLQRAVTTGASQIGLDDTNSGSSGRSVITAGSFEATFTGKNRIQSLDGRPNAKIVTSTPGQPDRVVTSQEVLAQFESANGRQAITNVVQQGNVQYREGQRHGNAERVRFVPAEDSIHMSGLGKEQNPRFEDKDQGFAISARTLRLNRKTGEVLGEGDVKTTYNQMKANSAGSMFASAEPIHATAATITANRDTGVARFTGNARLWQGANMVQAPVIVFDKNKRSLAAYSGGKSGGEAVQTVFVQTDKSGKTVPISVSAQKFDYSDTERKGQFEGDVKVKSPDTTMDAYRVEITLRPQRDNKGGAQASMASQVEQVVATAGAGSKLLIEQENPSRKAEGDRLVYTAAESKFVLTGLPGNPPSIFDAERGKVTGDSLTFFTHDDRVQVESSDSSRTTTRTRIKNESKP